MSRYNDDDEQLQALKAWWQKNGTWLLSGVLVVVVAWSGWTYWQNHQLSKAMQGSAMFELVQAQAQQDQIGEILRDAKQFLAEQPESPYATGIALILGKHYFDQAAYDDALAQYDWVIRHSPDASLSLVASLRSAKVALQQGNPASAQAYLDAVSLKALAPEEKANYHFMAGEVAMAQQAPDQARTHYESVLSVTGLPDGLKNLTRLKLSDLAGN
ncbi:tetratricopeptide repeat protein [Thiomicrospira sp. WB1]|uniref:YfgM family protein n=1 Tax=Thiomicrospira sp. WB1 TaxID=1685380 RepID=UPI000749EB1F|nr:tetratricopeptide repeat protein [Thiomicrospira sp. WB1]KUJ71440.1 hypothetical protein AVO41_07885 [Thiomicrospira sp. WB1]